MTQLDLQVTVGANDGYSVNGGGSFYNNSGSTIFGGAYTGFSGADLECWMLFSSGVSGLSGVTIDSALLTVRAGSAGSLGSPLTKIFAEDSASPGAPTTESGHAALTRTSAGVDWDTTFTPNIDNVAPDITAVIQELADSYDPSGIQLLLDDDGSSQASSNYLTIRTVNFSSSLAPRLVIIHSTAPAGAIASRRLLSGTGR